MARQQKANTTVLSKRHFEILKMESKSGLTLPGKIGNSQTARKNAFTVAVQQTYKENTLFGSLFQLTNDAPTVLIFKKFIIRFGLVKIVTPRRELSASMSSIRRWIQVIQSSTILFPLYSKRNI